jgi:pyruvate,water dikinase
MEGHGTYSLIKNLKVCAQPHRIFIPMGGIIGMKVLVKGVGSGFGLGKGRVKIIKSMDEVHSVSEGDVIVVEAMNPVLTIAMEKANGIITDTGGKASHAAIIARELEIPCVVGTSNATKILREGQVVMVDGEKGIVYEPE